MVLNTIKENKMTFFFSFVNVCSVAKLCLTLAILWTAARQSLSIGFPWQEYWSGLPFPSPGDFPNLGIESTSPAL